MTRDPTEDEDAGESLRTRVLRGGVFLLVRQVLGTIVGFAAVMAIVRLIGPAEYGIAAAAVGVATYAVAIFQFGIGAYVVRHEGEVADEDKDQAFTCMLAFGILGLAVSLACVPLLDSAMGVARFRTLAAIACGTIPVSAIACFPSALLERALDFRRIAFAEMVSQLLGHATALALTIYGLGGLALVIGLWAKEVSYLALLVRCARYRPKLRWERARASKILRYGLGLGVAGWVWQVGSVLTPIAITRLAGAEVLGVVTLTGRFLDQLGIVLRATRQIGFAALARIQGDREKLSRACTEAMIGQVLAIGPLLFAFGIAAPLVLPRLLGHRWDGVMTVYPLLAVAALGDAAFGFHDLVLNVLARNWQVVVYYAARRALELAGLVLFVPRLGLLGCGYAELVPFVAFLLAQEYVFQQGLAIDYRVPLAFVVLFALSFFHEAIGWPVALAPLAIALWPGTWRIVAANARSFFANKSTTEVSVVEEART